MSEQRHQVRQRPSERRHELEVTQDQHGYERCPDLRLDRIGVGPEERFDLQVLFDRFKKQFHFPPVLVNQSNRFGGKAEIVREEGK